MKETGIMFTPDNHRAILEGRKTQTRRVIKPQPQPNGGKGLSPVEPYHTPSGKWTWVLAATGHGNGTSGNWCPYGVPGDRLYIKEGVITHASIPQLVGYYMDGCRVTEHWEKRLTAMFMPKRFARTWLEITNVRVQRVQEISEADCVAEGCPKDYLLGRNWYKNLWDEINGKKHPWASNPWVWVLTFKLLGEVRG